MMMFFSDRDRPKLPLIGTRIVKIHVTSNTSVSCSFLSSSPGISTSTGIPDFRSGMNTVLETGPGAWELRDAGKKRTKAAASTLKAIPSVCHMALKELVDRGMIKVLEIA